MKIHNGFLLVNKPLGLTSFDVIRKMRFVFSCKKIGHAGTLDPLAEGLLILAFGQATRLLQFLTTEPKVYRFELQFGSETDTLDKSGKTLRSGGAVPREDALRAVLPEFVGKISQIPPVFSAIKINGERAYTLARKGLSPDMKPRTITIDALSLSHYDSESGRALCEVNCSGGTYVRSLARDIAYRLDTVGFTNSIIRTACGRFSINDALIPDRIDPITELIPLREALDGIPAIQADDTTLDALLCGRNIALPHCKEEGPEHVLVFSGERFIALVHKTNDNCYHPDIVTMVSGGNTSNAHS